MNIVIRKLGLSLFALTLLSSCSSCSSRNGPAQAARDAAPDPDLPSSVVAVVPSASSTPPSAKAANTDEKAGRDALVAWLQANLPKGGSVDASGAAPRVFHTVAPNDAYPALAAAYVELTEIYAAGDLAKALEKRSPSLVVGQKIEIPSVITRAPREPREEKLGWPEDRALRAVFFTGPVAAQKWTDTLEKMVPRGLNAVVLDAKDYQGPVNYPTKAKIAVEINAAAKPSIPNLARIIRFAHWRGVRVILRIPCFHDPYADKRLKGARLSLKHAQTGMPLRIDWLDPTNTEAQDYAIELAKEGVEAGADEINLDYVRFPVHVDMGYAKMPDPKDRSNAIRDFVRRVHAVTQPAGVMLSLDLFGVTATGERSDIERLGQDIAVIGPEAEVIMPMVYPSHYDKGYRGWEKPGDHPEIVGIGTKAAIAQLEKVKAKTVVRSWLQAFSWRTSIYGPKYVVDQAKSAESNGGVGWAMWSPACEYGAVYQGFPPKP
ncbi:MAG: hypothetical protein KF819_21355 [Labilithrix sp.]|nr:hypothetical protein [Labilithrix sp.]